LKLHSSRKFFFLLLAGFLLPNLSGSGLVPTAFAEGTRTWEQSKFDELIKGTAKGVAIRSTGGLELAPTFKSLYATPSTYIWAIAADDAGTVYVAAGAPARVYRITPDGKATIIFEPKELQVQALQIGAGGAIYAATAPDGKVYKIEHKPGSKTPAKQETPQPAPSDKDKDKDAAKPSVDASWSSSVYFEPGTKYIWDLALDKSGNLYVATGDHGEIYRVSPKGEHSVFFKSDETHIRALAFDAQDNLIAGSDGSGLIYRISPAGEGFVLYSAPKKEITALALDRAGNIYAAAVGEKRGGSGASSAGAVAALLSMSTSAPASGSAPQVPGMTMSAAPSAPATTGPFPFPGGSAGSGSDVYRIAPDGSPTRLWTSHEDIVYALAFDSQGRLLAGTGNRGHIFAIAGLDDFSDLLKAAASQVTAFAKAPGGGVYAAASNLGKVFVLGADPEAQGSYESDVFDARIFSRWGRAEFRGLGNVDLYARSGNVDNPDRNWSAWKKIDLGKNDETGIPAARYAQWKAVLHTETPAPNLDSVALNYLSKNVAPEIDDVAVQVGIKYQPLPKSTGISLGSDSSSLSSGTHFEAPTPSSHDRDSIGVKWSAHDENDDQLVYSVYYRGDGQTRWLLLKDNISDKAYSFDASLLPDGGYTVKVIASDAPSHSPGEALTASRESRRFEVDTTPPRIENLSATLEGSQIHVNFRAVDGFSAIKRAEYSVDAGEWKYVEPAGQLSDAKTENYDFKATPETGKDGGISAEHVVVVRVYDRYENMGAAKTVLRPR
jgi:outer membrane protein assembly factor BamB